MSEPSRLPPGQQLAAPHKWPVVGEQAPAPHSEAWTLQVSGAVLQAVELSLDDLACLPQVERAVDIHCVTRWSKLDMHFAGVLLADVLKLAEPTGEARFISFVARSGRGHSTSLPLDDAVELGTLLATHCQGEPLGCEHGGPLRTVVPQRYFYKSLKWLSRIELLHADRLGYWEAEAGYHNQADPWRQQRFIASSISKQQAAALLASRDLSGRTLLGLDASGRDLIGLQAGRSVLRNACFDGCRLEGADFRGANLSAASFRHANLAGAAIQDADLEGANFAGALLRGVDFSGASLLAATFCEGDHSATLDRTTRLDPAQVAQLMPRQEQFVLKQLSDG